MFASLHTAPLMTRHVQSGSTFARIATFLRLALTARRQRLNLAQLDDTLLADIGMTRADARVEAARPLWDVPSNWLR